MSISQSPNFQLTALDLCWPARVVLQHPSDFLDCFDGGCLTKVSLGRTCEQQYWKKFEPHYALKFTLGLDESKQEWRLRLFRDLTGWCRLSLLDERRQLRLRRFDFHFDSKDILQARLNSWCHFLYKSTKNVAMNALECIMTSDIDKLDVALVKKFIRGVRVMKNLERKDLESITDKLSWLLPKLKDDGELRSLFVEMLSEDPSILDRAINMYDTERLEFCIRSGIPNQDFVIFTSKRTTLKNTLTFLNFGYSISMQSVYFNIIDMYFYNKYDIYDIEDRISEYTRIDRKFWLKFTAHCYFQITDYKYSGQFDNYIESTPDSYSFRALPDGYKHVDELGLVRKDYLETIRYGWRSNSHSYLSGFEFYEALYEIERSNSEVYNLCQWYAREICEKDAMTELLFITPRSLQQYCRVAIRRQLRKNNNDLVKLIDQLDITAIGKEYLKMYR